MGRFYNPERECRFWSEKQGSFWGAEQDATLQDKWRFAFYIHAIVACYQQSIKNRQHI